MFIPCFVMQYLVSFLVCNHLAVEENAGYLSVDDGYWCYVSLSRGTVAWSTVCDCGISWSHSLTFRIDTNRGHVVPDYISLANTIGHRLV